MLNYFGDTKYFLFIFSVNVYCIQAEMLIVCRRWSRWIFLLRNLDNTHITFLKNVILMLTKSNSRNFLSEIITKKPTKITDKNLPFSVGFFSPNFVALFIAS